MTDFKRQNTVYFLVLPELNNVLMFALSILKKKCHVLYQNLYWRYINLIVKQISECTTNGNSNVTFMELIKFFEEMIQKK